MLIANEFSQADLTSALELYGVGPVRKFSLASQGIENVNYLVTAATERETQLEVVLTILQQASNTPGSIYVELMQQSDAAGLPIPRLYLGADSAAHQVYQGHRLLLSKRLRGQHLVNPGATHVAAVGRFLARWHSATAGLAEQSQPHPRDSAWLLRTWESVQTTLDYQEQSLLDDAVQACCAMLARQDVADLPCGFVHGDCFRDNLLFDGNALSGVLDFHHAARGTWIFDLAVVANDWCVDGSKRLDSKKTLDLLRAYHALRPLSTQELWWFSTFCLYAATAFCLSRLQAKVDGQQRQKDYRELLPVVQEHLLRPQPIDARLLS